MSFNFLSDFERELGKTTNDDSFNDQIKSSKRKELFNSYLPDVTKDEIKKKMEEMLKIIKDNKEVNK